MTTYLPTLPPNPAAAKKRERAVKACIDRMGDAWLLHPSNHITQEGYTARQVALRAIHISERRQS